MHELLPKTTTKAVMKWRKLTGTTSSLPNLQSLSNLQPARLTAIYASLALEQGRLPMSYLGTRPPGYISIGVSFKLVGHHWHQTYIFLRAACSYKLDSYLSAGIRKPYYRGFTSFDEASLAWEHYLDTRTVPPTGSVSATPVSPPATPQRNRNLQGTTYSHPSPRMLRSPSTPQRDSPNPPVRGVCSPPPQHSSFSQARTTIPRQAETLFFAVFAGYSPGVYASR